MKNHIITIDGPAGTGKSTVAGAVASSLGFTFLDTGALYRACALAVDRQNGDIDNEEECCRIVKNCIIRLDGNKVFLNDDDISLDIRTNRISSYSSKIASHQSVRNALLDIQRSYAKIASIVAEGRDTGSVIFPYADIKIYLDAAPEERALRRLTELKEKGSQISFEQILKDVNERDLRDKSRKSSPLTIPADATVVDTTHLNLKEVIEAVLYIANKKLSY